MPRSAYRRAATAPRGRSRRLFAVGAVIAAVGLAVAFTSISNAATSDRPAGSGAGKVVNGQVILTDTCVDSNLQPHDGFQKGDRCVSTAFGEVSRAGKNPGLLITDFPDRVEVNTPFTLRVSTRNLIRDRFLAAGQGGYYVESAVLKGGITRGHFHTSCRMLPSTDEAPRPEPVPAFFVATEDSRGGARPDEVVIQVPGLPEAGIAQCASWAGDGSHRVPMMERANQTPPLDAVRITVGGNNGDGNGNNNNGGGGNGDGGNDGNDGNDNNNGNDGNNNGGGNEGNNNGGGNGGNNNGGGGNGGNNNGGNNNGGGNGGNNNGGNNSPSTKDDFTPKPTTKPTPPAKPTTGANVKSTTTSPKSTTESTTKRTSDESDESNESSAEGEDEIPTVVSTQRAAPSPSTEDAGTDYTYSNDDGQFNSGNDAPLEEQIAEAQNAAAEQEGDILALTGTNAVAAVGAGAVLLLVGLIIMSLTRRRPRGSSWQ